MSEEKSESGPELTGFLVDERSVIFIRDRPANLRFLDSVDPGYWGYQGATHGTGLDDMAPEDRQRAVAALRIA